ncbi:MAG: protein translocase subunit SecD [Pirellulales bacterium]
MNKTLPILRRPLLPLMLLGLWFAASSATRLEAQDAPADNPPAPQAETDSETKTQPAPQEAPPEEAPPEQSTPEEAPAEQQSPEAQPAADAGPDAAQPTEEAPTTPTESPTTPAETDQPAVPEQTDIQVPETEAPDAQAPDAPAGSVGAAETTAEPAEAEESAIGGLWLLLIVLAVLVVPFLLGGHLGRKLRMPDHSWKIGLVLCTVLAAAVICYFGWPPKLGPDLSGGVKLIYEIDPEAKAAGEEIQMEQMIAALAQRVNPGGVKEVIIRPYGQEQVEIVIPKAGEAEIRHIKRTISTSGALEFRIVANRNDHEQIIEAALADPGSRVVEMDGRDVARWVILDEQQFDLERETGLITRPRPDGQTEVLVILDPRNVTGDMLARVSEGVDETGRPAVNFRFNARGATQFGRLTGDNLPIRATNFFRRLGIVLDNRLLSAPQIQSMITEQGQISGDFTKQEIQFIISILSAGSLPTALNSDPISQEDVSATLGADTVRAGSRAMALGMIVVPLFMLFYYRFAGIVACAALFTNLLLILAVMVLINAAFTLPGLAGLVLTIGMAVDANVLIFERIREELNRGAALRMAIRNGFDRATTAIVDSNVTTLITAVVLYAIGTDQIKGFAVTLFLGITMSMYTAIFCSRVIFDIAEKRRWITQLKMAQLLGSTRIDFFRKWPVAVAASLVLIVIGMAALVSRGKDILDIDFLGGTSITVLFQEDAALDIASVRQVVSQNEALPDVTVIGVGENQLQYSINTSNRDIQQVQSALVEEFEGRLRTNAIEFTPPEVIPGAPGDTTNPYAGGARTELTFSEAIDQESLAAMLRQSFEESGIEDAAFRLSNPNYQPGSNLRFQTWTLQIAVDAEPTREALAAFNDQLQSMPVFPSASNIGSQVAGDMQRQAAYALFGSLMIIIGYIWIRFEHISFGLAAVVALVHDVLVTLGALALSAYIVSFLPGLASVLLLDPFKISLPIIAAFLTIIGYSLNDTIVIFDRIREVRGKSPDISIDMINVSINQTLSRTLITSFTTLLVVVILYAVGGAGIHGFAFAMVVGVVAGVFSTIYMACPVLYWMTSSPPPKPAQQPRMQHAAKTPAAK